MSIIRRFRQLLRRRRTPQNRKAKTIKYLKTEIGKLENKLGKLTTEKFSQERELRSELDKRRVQLELILKDYWDKLPTKFFIDRLGRGLLFGNEEGASYLRVLKVGDDYIRIERYAIGSTEGIYISNVAPGLSFYWKEISKKEFEKGKAKVLKKLKLKEEYLSEEEFAERLREMSKK